jgi:phosphoglycolate phosphatase
MKGLVLFDIDKTLIRGSTSRSSLFSDAFREIYGVNTTREIVNIHGMTDQQVIFEVLKKNGLTEKEILLKIEECMDFILDSFKKIEESFEVELNDGVLELLEELKKQDFLMGLVTGNFEQIARVKMKKASINHYFQIGGFGSDNISRTELVRAAIRRAEEKNFKKDNNIFLFGDTPQDMNAGSEAGIATIGVTTGIYSKKDLENAGADYVVSDLQNTQKILNIILGKMS